jgi:hypothetical protein
MLTIIAIILGLLAINFAALYWKGLREARGLSEYAQHLLLHPESYEDQRKKFIAYLAGTKDKKSSARSVGAAAALARIADNMRGQLMQSNQVARDAVALGRNQ